MKLLTIIKGFALISGSTVLGTSSITPIIQLVNNNSENIFLDYNSFNWLVNKIKNNSQIIGDEKHYSYDGHYFESEGELDNYIFNNGKIKSYVTSSNPEKIIKDYEHETLDESKIFNTNINDFVQVFETASKKPTLDYKTALRSYINQANAIKEFSYDGINWFDTEYEAKAELLNNTKINKSLYYVFNDKYYNAFNEDDINDLLASMEDGYYFEFNNDLNGNKLLNQQEISKKTNEIIPYFKPILKKQFNNYYKKLIDIESENAISLVSGTGEISVIDANTDQLLDLAKKNETLTIHFPNNTYYSEENMYNDFLDKSNWSGKYERYFNIIINGVIKKVKISLSGYWKKVWVRDEPANGNNSGTGWPGGIKHIYEDRWFPFDFDELKLIDKTVGKVKFYYDENKTKYLDEKSFDNLYNLNLSDEAYDTFFDDWYDWYSTNIMTDFSNERPTWFNFKNEKYLTNKNKDFVLGNIYKDKRFKINNEKGTTISLIEALKNWKIEKETLIKTISAVNPDDKVYEIAPGLKVSKNDLDNFLPLKGPGIDTRVLYTPQNDANPSDKKGMWLTNSEYQAKELKRLFLNKSLKTRYILYDIDGIKYEPIYTDNIHDALESIKNKYKLNSRFVNKDEYNDFESTYGRKANWNDLVSNGKYLVYRIDSPYDSNKGIWYKSESKALKEIKNNLFGSTNLKQITEHYLMYSYIDEKGVMLPIKFKESELEQVAKLIYEKLINI